MIELSTHIEYLLLNRDEVSVPLLGTFLVKEMSSRRVDEEGIFLPPYRTVTFRWNRHEEGEDFIASLSRMHGISRQETRMMCVEYIDELLQALDEEGSVSFGSMGYLLRDAESGEIQFRPMPSGIASPAYYGLDAVPFARLSREVKQQRARRLAARRTRLTSIEADHDIITIRINRRVFNYATAVAASVVLFFAITSPFGKSITSSVSQKAEFFLAPDNAVEPEAGIAVSEEPETEPTVVPARSDAPKDYAIVLASAISEKRAINYAAWLQEKGYDAQACVDGKMVRVIIPGFATEEEAHEMIRQCRTSCQDFSQAWPCRMKDEVKILSATSPQ